MERGLLRYLLTLACIVICLNMLYYHCKNSISRDVLSSWLKSHNKIS